MLVINNTLTIHRQSRNVPFPMDHASVKFFKKMDPLAKESLKCILYIFLPKGTDCL